MNKFNLTALAATCCFALSSAALGANMPRNEYKAAKDEIAAKYKSDKAACKAMTGNAKDICMEEAKGREKVAKAELDAKNNPTAKNQTDVRIAKANAAYEVAKEKCDELSGNAKDVCVKEAKAAHTTAKADAKAAAKTADATATARDKTAAATATARDKTASARREATADKRDAGYSVAKEKCDALAGDAKENCIRDAKAKYGQS